MPFACSSDTVAEPRIIAGTPLQPFSLGHHLIFKRLGLPFTDAAGAPATFERVMTGIAICAQPHQDTLRDMLNGDWDGVFARWTKKLQGGWLKRISVSKSEIEDGFRDYLFDGYRKPPVNRYLSKSKIELTAPWEQYLKCTLISAGFSEAEVLGGYLPARWYDYFTVMELRQLDKCRDENEWRKVFYTEGESVQIKGVE